MPLAYLVPDLNEISFFVSFSSSLPPLKPNPTQPNLTSPLQALVASTYSRYEKTHFRVGILNHCLGMKFYLKKQSNKCLDY